MCLVWIPRPKRPLEGRLIVELESCYCGGEYFQICFPSIDCDIYKCPKYIFESHPEKRPKKAKKGCSEESKIKDTKKFIKYDFSANFIMLNFYFYIFFISLNFDSSKQPFLAFFGCFSGNHSKLYLGHLYRSQSMLGKQIWKYSPPQ